MTGIALELISDIDIYLFIEIAMRGGISYIAKRCSKANNKYMKDYDNTEETIYIMYFDANNLYGSAMTEYLLYGGFEWITEEEINNFDFSSVRKDSPEGYILEVDLEYPSELHDYFDDYPPAPEKLKVTNDILSKYCSDIANKHGIRVGEVNNLIPNLGNKKKYVIHYRNLQLYISLGMKLKKFHRILKFKQSDWMKKYIDFNTEKRKNANNNYEKNFFKLMINSVYGKKMKNLRKRVNVKLINNAKDYVKSVSRPTFVSQKIFSKNLVIVIVIE